MRRRIDGQVGHPIIGRGTVPVYATFMSLLEEDFVAGMTLAQTKEEVADAVMSFGKQRPLPEEGNVFIESNDGLPTESTMQKGASFWAKR